VAFQVWPESAERAAQVDPYAGLLASLHSMSLAANATGGKRDHETFDLDTRRRQFLHVQFTHRMAELQLELREKLGFRTDRPTHHGLAHGWTDPNEAALRRDFELLQSMDKLSLAACCTRVPNAEVKPTRLTVSGPDEPLHVIRPTPEKLQIDPWPFGVPTLETTFEYRPIPARSYESENDLHETMRDTPQQTQQLALCPRPR
jgi:hypothetical protein